MAFYILFGFMFTPLAGLSEYVFCIYDMVDPHY